MLILTRYPHQGDRSVICIDQDIKITLLDIEGDQVKLAIDLPDHWKVSLKDSVPLPPRPQHKAATKG